MKTLKDYVEWKLTHPKKKSRNIYHKDIVYFVDSGWNLNRDTAIVTDSSITAYATADSKYGNLYIYLGKAKDYAGKTISMTYTPVTDTVLPGSTALKYNKTANASTACEYGYFSTITIPDDVTDTDVITIFLYAQNLTKGGEVKIDNIMVYEGTEILPYEPYQG